MAKTLDDGSEIFQINTITGLNDALISSKNTSWR